MSQGVYTFRGGTDVLIRAMKRRARSATASSCSTTSRSTASWSRTAAPSASRPQGRFLGAEAVISNANLKHTVLRAGRRTRTSQPTSSRARAPCGSTTRAARSTWASARGESIPFVTDLLFTLHARDLRLARAVRHARREPHVLVLLPEDAPGPRTATRSSARPTRTTRTGRDLDERRVRAREGALDRGHARAASSATCPARARQDRPRRGRHAAHLPLLHPALAGASFGTKFEGLRLQHGPLEAGRAACTTPARSGSSCPAGWARRTTA